MNTCELELSNEMMMMMMMMIIIAFTAIPIITNNIRVEERMRIRTSLQGHSVHSIHH